MTGVAPQSTTEIIDGVISDMGDEIRALHVKAVFDSSHDAIITKNLDGIITSWNKGAHVIFGYPAEAMLGKPMSVLFPADRQHEERAILVQLFDGEKEDCFETAWVRKDGAHVHVSVTISPIRDNQGNVIGALQIARDITLQKMAGTLLKIRTENIRAIFNSSNDAIISKTLDGLVTSWNPGAEVVFGYTADEMLGRPMFVLFPSDRKDEERDILQKFLNGEKVDNFETVRLHKNGNLIDVSVAISLLRDNDGKIIGVSKIARDITSKKRADARLKLTSNVFTHTAEAIVIVNKFGRVIEVNEAFTGITGYQRNEVIGKNLRRFKSSYPEPEVFNSMLHELTENGHCKSEVWGRRKSGETFASLLCVSTVYDRDGLVENYIAIFGDITPLREQQERLERLAHFDALTDLPNRLLLSDRLDQAIARSKRHHEALAVLYVDLDGFKVINDRYGHEAGDELLVMVSHRMKGAVREVDTVARIGGDEFVVVLVDIQGLEVCRQLVNRILKACAEPIGVSGRFLQVSASIGVTFYRHGEADADQLIRHADRAMYEAKQAGKNRYVFFDPTRDGEIKNREDQLGRIGRALELQEFVLHYQPKVNLLTGTVIGVEALIRWNHPDQGFLLPATFMPAIENDPLNEAVTDWVMNTALYQMAEWRKQGIAMPVSINIGAQQLQQHNFVAHLVEILMCHPDINPQDLELEILETCALDDIGQAARVMRDCNSLGVCFAIDDFGTGYSSLTYLKALPAATLKIDKSFVRNMLNDQEDLAIVKGIIGLAAAFHRKVIAEGVETLEQGKKLLELGCELSQGYYFSRPMAGAELSKWLSVWQQRVPSLTTYK